jgi:ABC-type transport system substrate-binding protein
MFSRASKIKHAVSRTATIVIVVVIIIIIAVGGYAALTSFKPGSSSSTTSSSTSTGSGSTTTSSTTSSSTSSQIPTTFTYSQTQTVQYLDPDVSYYSYDFTIMQNVYETLLSYNGTSPTQVVPWLAQSYSVSPDLKTVNFTLRQGITFQDGEPFNSSAVYFSLNRLLVEDGSSYGAGGTHGTQASWILQQLNNHCLSTTLSSTATGCSGTPTFYTSAWLNAVLAQNFIQITGPYTFTMHILNPNAAWPFLLSNNAWADILAPSYVMQKDIALWQTNGYTLNYTTLSGNFTNQVHQYFVDEISTCNTGLTPKGCGQTYLDTSTTGSLAGTGPYILTSHNAQTDEMDFSANANYWGGAYSSKITPKIQTIKVLYTPDDQTRENQLKAAASGGQAYAIDVTAPHLYDVADRNAWLQNNQLTSTISGVSIYGPVTGLNTLFDPFSMNVTNPSNGLYYTFQPFADQRIRLAFADSVNMSAAQINILNKLGTVANNVVAPNLSPPGVYNATNNPIYSYNPDAAAQLLVQAMESPLTHFTFVNGTVAPPGLFNNSFGCTTLPSSNSCTNPIVPNPNVIELAVGAGDPIDEEIFVQMATVINNITSTYNMGWSVAVESVPTGQLLTNALIDHYYVYSLGWFADYPWVTDFLGPMYAPANTYTAGDGWNLTAMGTLYAQAIAATSTNNATGLIKVTNEMNTIANQNVMYLWTFYQENILVMTSNVQGFVYNPALSTNAAGDALQQFAYLY